MKGERVKLFDFLAVGFTLVLAINMVIVFFLALFNGGEYLVTINRFGEQWIEAVLFPLWIGVGVITLIRLTRRS